MWDEDTARLPVEESCLLLPQETFTDGRRLVGTLARRVGVDEATWVCARPCTGVDARRRMRARHEDHGSSTGPEAGPTSCSASCPPVGHPWTIPVSQVWHNLEVCFMRDTVMVEWKRIALGVALALVSSCGPSSSSDSDPGCISGKDCVCDGTDCDVVCDGDSHSGCNFKCKGGATCTFTCEGGGCNMDCAADTTCSLGCAGGNCATTASAAKSVQIDCAGNGCGATCGSSATLCAIRECTSNCALNCGGAAGCSNSCDMTAACTTTN